MSIQMPPAAEILFQTIKNSAQSSSYIRRIHDGKTHEAFLTTAAWALARQCGLDANLVEFASSTHPIGEEQASNERLGSRHVERREDLLLEIQGWLVGLRVEYNPPTPGLAVLAYQSRQAVQDAGFAFHAWNDADENGALIDAASGMLELEYRNDLEKLAAQLQALAMHDVTPASLSKTNTGVRF